MSVWAGVLALVLAAEARAEPLLVELTISGAAAPVEISLPIADERGCASIDERRQDAEYKVTVCQRGSAEGSPILSFEVERELTRPDGVDRRRVTAEVRIALGRSARIARYREGKSSMDIDAKVTRLETK